MLCRKAGVPAADVRGSIASQLYNAKEPMTLFELQAWLGHRSPQSTQFYAKISASTLTRAYTDAGYFSRNVRTIEVLIDRDAVAAGTAASGEPWQHYDLGHGYCAYTFFEQCPHRMACARCDFYTPQGLGEGPAAGGQDQPAEDDRRHPAHRGRAGGRRGRAGRDRASSAQARRHAHAGRADTTPSGGARHRQAAPCHRRPPRQNRTKPDKFIPQNDLADGALDDPGVPGQAQAVADGVVMALVWREELVRPVIGVVIGQRARGRC